MFSAKLIEIIARIGKKAIWRKDGMDFPFIIEDVKLAYGKVLYKVKGADKWVSDDNVIIANDAIKTTWEIVKEALTPW